MSKHLLTDIYKSLSNRNRPNFWWLGIFLLKKITKLPLNLFIVYAIPEFETPQPEMS